MKKELRIRFGKRSRALHSELELKISSRVSSRNEFFAISEVQVERHFFVLQKYFGNVREFQT